MHIEQGQRKSLHLQKEHCSLQSYHKNESSASCLHLQLSCLTYWMAHHVLFRCSIGNRCQKRWFYQDNLNRTTTVSLLAIISLLVTEQENIIPPWSFPTCWHLLPASASRSFSQLVSWTACLWAQGYSCQGYQNIKNMFSSYSKCNSCFDVKD